MEAIQIASRGQWIADQAVSNALDRAAWEDWRDWSDGTVYLRWVAMLRSAESWVTSRGSVIVRFTSPDAREVWTHTSWEILEGALCDVIPGADFENWCLDQPRPGWTRLRRCVGEPCQH